MAHILSYPATRRVLLGLGFCLAAAGSRMESARAAVLDAYATEMSLTAGQTLQLHVSSSWPGYDLSIWRQAVKLERIVDLGTQAGVVQPPPPDAAENGCGWSVGPRVTIDAGWRPGAYIAQLEAGGRTTRIPFVVRPRLAAAAGSMLVQLCVDTWQAYNVYGGKSLYEDHTGGPLGRATHVSFDRPFAISGTTDGSGQFFLWEAPFLSFLESQGYAYEVCTNVDLHRDPHLLDAYKVFVSVGHDEYYSKEMYDALERFVNAGGNLAFFSGNTLWWQVRFEKSNRTLVCYKSASLDPLTGIDNSRVTVNWHAPPVQRPPSQLMGSAYNGSSGIPPGAYQVVNPNSWVFAGLQTTVGQSFGYPMVAYEVDARDPHSPPVDVLARTTLPDHNDGNVLRPAEMTYYERSTAYGFAAGKGGKVFAGGTVNFSQGLVSTYNPATKTQGQADPVARTVAVNVLDRLDCTLSAPQLESPTASQAVPGGTAFLQWGAAVAQRSDIDVRYMVFCLGDDGRLDSLGTRSLSIGFKLRTGPKGFSWWVRARSACGATATSIARSFRVRDASPTDTGPAASTPLLFVHRDGASISIDLYAAGASRATFDVYDVAGRRKRTLGERDMSQGAVHLSWDMRDDAGARLGSGIYIVDARLGQRRLHQKCLVLE